MGNVLFRLLSETGVHHAQHSALGEFNKVLIENLAEVIEFFGVIIIAVSVLVGVYILVIKNKLNFNAIDKNPIMNHGLTIALEIILAAEILKTLIVREVEQVLELGALVFIRILITVLIHWELSNKEKNMEITEEEKERAKVMNKESGERI